MFIGERRNQCHPLSGVPRPPSGGPCQSLKTRDALYNMALLAEGVASRLAVYKHGPPDGGRATAFACRLYFNNFPTLRPYNLLAISAFYFSTLSTLAL